MLVFCIFAVVFVERNSERYMEKRHRNNVFVVVVLLSS